MEDVITVLQCNRLRWYGQVLRKDDSEWVKKCMDFVVEVVRPLCRPKRTWKEVVEEDFEVKEDALVRSKYRRLIKGTEKDSDDSGG